MVQPNFGAAGFAALAPLVAAAAVQDLAEARCILERSALALATSIRTVAVKLQLDRPDLVGHGGALEHLDGFSRLVKTAVNDRSPIKPMDAGRRRCLSWRLGDGPRTRR